MKKELRAKLLRRNPIGPSIGAPVAIFAKKIHSGAQIMFLTKNTIWAPRSGSPEAQEPIAKTFLTSKELLITMNNNYF